MNTDLIRSVLIARVFRKNTTESVMILKVVSSNIEYNKLYSDNCHSSIDLWRVARENRHHHLSSGKRNSTAPSWFAISVTRMQPVNIFSILRCYGLFWLFSVCVPQPLTFREVCRYLQCIDSALNGWKIYISKDSSVLLFYKAIENINSSVIRSFW